MKWFVTMYTGYCGSTQHELVELPDNASEEYREQLFWEMAVDNAESFGYELCSDDCDDDECAMEHPGNTGIEGSGVPYNPEEHDGFIV